MGAGMRKGWIAEPGAQATRNEGRKGCVARGAKEGMRKEGRKGGKEHSIKDRPDAERGAPERERAMRYTSPGREIGARWRRTVNRKP